MRLRRQVQDLINQMKVHELEIIQLRKEVGCREHDWRFVRAIVADLDLWFVSRMTYVFKCWNCGKEIKRREKDLTIDQRKALKTLGYPVEEK